MLKTSSCRRELSHPMRCAQPEATAGSWHRSGPLELSVSCALTIPASESSSVQVHRESCLQWSSCLEAGPKQPAPSYLSVPSLHKAGCDRGAMSSGTDKGAHAMASDDGSNVDRSVSIKAQVSARGFSSRQASASRDGVRTLSTASNSPMCAIYPCNSFLHAHSMPINAQPVALACNSCVTFED